MSAEWSDEAFLGYVDLHSRTELALFNRAHAHRLYALAGLAFPWREQPQYSLEYYEIADVLKLAWARLRRSPEAT